jgi:CheY-like chemotaxis protein
MKMRQFIAGLALAAASFGALAADTSVIVVKVINFSCPICRASENQDAPVISAANATAGQFVYAPIPSEAGEYAREKVYYAVRKQGREAEKRVRESLYRGAQDVNMPFMDITQVIEWLKDDVRNVRIDWQQLTADANSPEAMQALSKAAVLTQRAGAQQLPAYILVQGNAPVATLDIHTSGKGTSLLNLREDVIKRIGQLASDTTN